MTNKILIAEDERLNLAIIISMLKMSGKGYEIIHAPDGGKACEMALTERPDLILMDWEMPVMSGIEAVKYLKAIEETKNIPIIMTTAMEGKEKLEEALNAGAVDYIRKPVDKIELLARVKSSLLIYNSFREIRKQKEKIQQQVTELEKLSLIAKETDNSIILLDKEGKLIWVNEGFKRLYEYELDEFKTKFGRKIFAGSETLNPDKVIAEMHQKKKPATYQTVIETKSVEFKWVQTRLTPIFDSNKNIKEFIAIETDITKLKEVERELKERNEGLVDLAGRLQEINTTQEKENQEITRQKEIIEKEKKSIEEEKRIVEDEKKYVEEEKRQTEALLFNILPENVAIQLKSTGSAKPRNYRMSTVLFTDFKGFTMSCEQLTPKELVNALHSYFVRFDNIIEGHYIEKIKTIGDAYMCVGGVPIRNKSNPIDVVLAGLEIQELMNNLFKKKHLSNIPVWGLRLGIHTGPVIAGVVGKKKFAYDIWGDTVNIAARMEQSGEVGKVNISGSTYEYIKEYFDCTYRGKIQAKNKGKVDMYFVNGLNSNYSHDEDGVIPNTRFLRVLNDI